MFTPGRDDKAECVSFARAVLCRSRFESGFSHRNEQGFRRVERMMANKIPAEELHRAESKCNALLDLQEDYQHVVSELEGNYSTRVRENHIRQIVGGGAGPEQIVLEEESTWPV